VGIYENDNNNKNFININNTYNTKKPVQDDQQKKMHEMRMSGKKI